MFNAEVLEKLEPLGRGLVVRVWVRERRLDPSAQALVGQLAILGSLIEPRDIDAIEPGTRVRGALNLVILEESATPKEAKHQAWRFRDHSPVLLGPPLPPHDVIELLAGSAKEYFRLEDPPMETAARLLLSMRSEGSGIFPRNSPATVEVGCVILDQRGLILRGPDGNAEITDTESRLFQHLCRTPIATAAEIAREVLGRHDSEGRGRDLAYRHIANLRAKLRSVGAPTMLVRVRTGYRLLPADPESLVGS